MSGGRDDKTRVIVFTTEGNLRLLQSNREWLGFAFVPEDDVVEAFLLLRTSSPAKFKPILEYLEVYYIGKLVPLSRTSNFNVEFVSTNFRR